MIRCIGVLLFLAFGAGCVNTDYSGMAFAPTDQIDVYFADDAIEFDYAVMGRAKAESPNTVSYEKMERNLVKAAMANGADAIIILNMRKVIVGELSTQTIKANQGGPAQSRYYNTDAGLSRGVAAQWYGRPYSTEAKNKVVIADLIKYR
jgi:hypothetical protein